MRMYAEEAGVAAARVRRRSGVTLVEVMLATSILAVLTMLAAQAVDAVTDVWLAGRGRSESFATARALLSRLRTDIEAGVMRSDVPGFPNTDANKPSINRLEFCSRVRSATQEGGDDDRRLTYISYTLEKEGRDTGYVVRTDTPYRWTESPFGSKADEGKGRRMCGNVLGFKHRFVVVWDDEPNVAKEYENTGSIRVDPARPEHLPRYGAVRVSLAVADGATFRLLESANLLSQALQLFRSSESEDWEKELVNAASTLPPAALRGIRIFHQAVPIVVSRTGASIAAVQE